MQIRHNPLSGGYCGEVPPLPIPNREVKLTCADGTAMQCGRVGSRLLLSRASDFERFLRLFCFHADWFFVTQISQMTQIFLWCFFFFPQISLMCPDFWPVRSGISQMVAAPFTFLPFYSFTFYSSFYFFTFIYFPVKNYGESSLVMFMYKMLMNGGFSL